MKIRTKVITGVLGLSVLLSVGLGLAILSFETSLRIQASLESKRLLVTSLAASIDGDHFSTFTTPSSQSYPEYQRILQYLHQVKESDPQITYLFTVLPEQGSERFLYAIDAEINATDTVWVETSGKALVLTREPEGKLKVVHLQKTEFSHFDVQIGNRARKLVREESASETRLLVDGRLLVSSRAGNPWVLQTAAGPVSLLSPEQTVALTWDKGKADVNFSFTASGLSTSSPGSPFLQTTERNKESHQILNTGKCVVFPELRRDEYGEYREAVGVIRNHAGAPVGLLYLDVYEGELAAMNLEIALGLAPILGTAFLLCFLFAWFGARHLTWPLVHFVKMAEKVRAGDLSSRLEFVRRDDYGPLATTVNHMMDNLELMTNEMNRHAQTLDFHAHHDVVTGLHNRRSFFRQIEGLLAMLSRLSEPPVAAVFFLDLDKFKEVNDTLGHDEGDVLLKMVSERLQECIRTGDQVFRLGGDEFVILASPLNRPEDAILVAGKIREALSTPFFISGHFVHIGVSQGISFYPNDGTEAQTLVKKADTALYESKRNGSEPVYFTPKMTEQMERSALLREDLHHALNHAQFHLVYQPIMDIRGRLVSAEALMRWNRPDGQKVAPDEFIPILEESSLIGQAGLWALHAARAQLQTWSNKGLEGFSVSVNLSVRQLKDKDFLREFEEVIVSSTYDPKRLYFEITETMIAKDKSVLDWLGRYADRGVPFAMDDFGTGYSSLSGITSLPIAYLKIDKHFVDLLPDNTKMRAIVRAIVQIADAIGVITVAEGVETAEQFEFLAGIGCARYQGYYFSQPLSPSDFFDRFESGLLN